MQLTIKIMWEFNKINQVAHDIAILPFIPQFVICWSAKFYYSVLLYQP